MSVHICSEVWNTNLPSGTKIVALALADMSNDERECWPSISSLEKRCGMQDNAIRAHLAKLIAMGILTRESRYVNNRQTSNLYIFCKEIPSRISGGHQMAYPPEIREGPLPNLGTLPPPEFREGEIHQEEPKEIPKGKAGVKSKSRGTEEEVVAYATELNLPESDGRFLFDTWESNGWRLGKQPIADWRAAFRTRKRKKWLPSLDGTDLPEDREIDYDAMPGDDYDPVVWMVESRRRLDEELDKPIQIED